MYLPIAYDGTDVERLYRKDTIQKMLCIVSPFESCLILEIDIEL